MIVSSKLITPDILEAQYRLLVKPEQVVRASQGRAVVSTTVITPEVTEIIYTKLYQKGFVDKILKLHESEKKAWGEGLTALEDLDDKNPAKRYVKNMYGSHSKMVDDLTEVKQVANW